MSRDSRMYSRIYWSAMDDPMFERVWPQDAALATWLRMLVLADASWPVKPEMPRMTPALRLLLEVGLVEAVAGNRYTLRGLEKERRHRSEIGRNAGIASGEARRRKSNESGTDVERSLNDRSPDVRNGIEPSRAEQSRGSAEHPSPTPPAEDRPGNDLDPEDAFDAYVLCTGRPPRGGALEWLNRLCEDHGEPNVAATIISEWRRSQKVSDLLGRVETSIAVALRNAEKRDRDQEAARIRREQEEVEQRARDATPEERERAAVRRRAIGVWIRTRPADPIPEDFDTLADWLAKHEQEERDDSGGQVDPPQGGRAGGGDRTDRGEGADHLGR